MQWLENLNQAIEYIESHLDQEISYEKIAAIAGCSPYYFQRMFTYITDTSLSEYIRQRRMTQAAFELQRTKRKVIDIAYQYGYQSPTAFNRAFQSVHGMTPTMARKQGSQLHAYPAMQLKVQIAGGNPLSYRIEKKDAIRIIGIRIPLTEMMEDNQKIVPQFWNEVLKTHQLEQLVQYSNHQPDGILGITVYENPSHIYYYIAVSSDHNVPENMFVYEIPAQTWVVFDNLGPFLEDVQNVFHRFMSEWLPFSGYEYANAPDIEVYPFNTQKSPCGHSQVWIAVKQRKEEKNESDHHN